MEYGRLKRENGVQKPQDIKVLMFGEGNFLRAFVGFLFHRINQNSDYKAGILSLTGLPQSAVADKINEQEGLYTVVEEGVESGVVVRRFTLVESLLGCLNAYEQYEQYLSLAALPELRIIVSNTTEKGICYDERETDREGTHDNYPAKLTDFLYHRYRAFGGDPSKALIILPCELIDQNGETLERYVRQYAVEWGYEPEFFDWLNENTFCNTLVDRIVSGYPAASADAWMQELGYQDDLLDVCEPFFLWAIEGNQEKLAEIPFALSGLNVVLTDRLDSYRTRKVRILNGAHTMSVLAGYEAGYETVDQMLDDADFAAYIRKGITEEIIPSFEGEDLQEYADAVLERFSNPFLHHKLLSIALNSISKFKVRVLGSLLDYREKYQKVPKTLCFAFAALIFFYKNHIDTVVKDDPAYMEKMRTYFRLPEEEMLRAVLSDREFWGVDMTEDADVYACVCGFYRDITKRGVQQVVKEVAKCKE